MDILAGRMGEDILLLDLAEVTFIADYFIIATGLSDRQLQAMAEAVREQLREEHGIRHISTEGTPESGWMLLDYGGVVVHLFSPAQRERYQLEKLWSNARIVVRIA